MILRKCSPLMILFFSLSLGHHPSLGQQDSGGTALASRLDPLIKEWIASEKLPGISIAVFDNEKILYHHASGVQSRSNGKPINEKTVFEAASLSKTVFAYLALTRMESFGLQMETPLYPILPLEDLRRDFWRSKITPRNVLSHTSGLPNWRGPLNLEAVRMEELFDPDTRLKFIARPNKAFHYSGEGYVYLQRVLELRMKERLDAAARSLIFEPMEMHHSSFVFEAGMEQNHALGHDAEGRVQPKVKPVLPLAAASLHTTATDFAKFMIHLIHEAKKNEALRHMFKAFVTAETGEDYLVDWGLGLGIIKQDGRQYLFHWGDNGPFKAYYIYSPGQKLGFVYLVNGEKGLSIRNQLVKAVFEGHVPMYPASYEQW